MTILTNVMWFILIFILLLGVGGIFLQIFLSKKENKYLGLILPLILFLFSLLPVLNLAYLPEMSGWQMAAQIATVLIFGNLYTFILLGSYFLCREKRKKQRQLDKMNIQDIE